MTRTIADILAMANDSQLAISQDCPYIWNNGDHDVEFTSANTLAIVLMMIYEGGDMPVITDTDLTESRAAAESETATDEDQSDYRKMRIQRAIQVNWEAYSASFLLLVACHQVTPLNTGNLENFCAMTGAPDASARTLTFLSYIASQMDYVLDDDDVASQFEDNMFFRYHTTASSTPFLMMQAIQETSGLNIFNEYEVDLISKAHESPDDIELARRVPGITLVKGHAVLEATGGLPDVWYMGSKAKDKFSAKRYTALKKILTRYFTLETNLENLGEMDRPAVVNALSELLAGFYSPEAEDDASADEDEGGEVPNAGDVEDE